MEILILGLILVALMAYLSTKIKAASAAAYQEELIQADNFSIVKPKDFLHPYNEKSEYAFEAYSKEFGEGASGKFHQVSAFIKVRPMQQTGLWAKGVNISEGIENDFIQREEVRSGVTFKIFQKRLCSSDKSYELTILALKDFYEANASSINKLLESFKLRV